MSTGWHGKQHKGAMRDRRSIKRAEAEERQRATRPERERAYRRHLASALAKLAVPSAA